MNWQVKKLIQDIRQERRAAEYLATGAFVLAFCATIAARLQGNTTSSNDSSSFLFLMLLGSLAIVYSRLTRRIAQVAETLADLQVTPASPAGPGGNLP